MFLLVAANKNISDAFRKSTSLYQNTPLHVNHWDSDYFPYFSPAYQSLVSSRPWIFGQNVSG